MTNLQQDPIQQVDRDGKPLNRQPTQRRPQRSWLWYGFAALLLISFLAILWLVNRRTTQTAVPPTVVVQPTVDATATELAIQAKIKLAYSSGQTAAAPTATPLPAVPTETPAPLPPTATSAPSPTAVPTIAPTRPITGVVTALAVNARLQPCTSEDSPVRGSFGQGITLTVKGRTADNLWILTNFPDWGDVWVQSKFVKLPKGWDKYFKATQGCKNGGTDTLAMP